MPRNLILNQCLSQEETFTNALSVTNCSTKHAIWHSITRVFIMELSHLSVTDVGRDSIRNLCTSSIWANMQVTSRTSVSHAPNSSITRPTCVVTCVSIQEPNPTNVTSVVRASYAKTTCWSTVIHTAGKLATSSITTSEQL